jgi:transposase
MGKRQPLELFILIIRENELFGVIARGQPLQTIRALETTHNGGTKMSNKLFTIKEVMILSRNPYVITVSNKGITYIEEFKRIFIAENEKGKVPREIFTECGFDIKMIGMERVKSSAKRWRTTYRKNGVDGLKGTRKGNSGRPSKKGAKQIKMTLEGQFNIVYNLKRIRRIMEKFNIFCPIRKQTLIEE